MSKPLGRIQILFQSATEKASLESFDSINDDDPPYKNWDFKAANLCNSRKVNM